MGIAAKYEGGGTIWEALYTSADDFCFALLGVTKEWYNE